MAVTTAEAARDVFTANHFTTFPLMKAHIRERRHRLPKEHYLGPQAASFTARLQGPAAPFVTRDIFAKFETILIEAIRKYNSNANIYLLMPDHLHCILSGLTEDSDILSAMKRFKQRTSFWLRNNLPGIRWQKDFFDHILRSEDELKKHVRYILNNPIRAGLVDDWRQYEFKGSTTYDLDDWSVDF